MIEDVDIVKSEPEQGLIETGDQVFSAAPVTVGPLPHVVAGFRRNDHLVSVWAEVIFKYPSEIALSASRLGAVVVCQIKVGDPIVKCGKAHLLHIGRIAGVAEIMPQAEL